MRWPWSKSAEASNSTLSVADPALAAFFSPGGMVDLAGVAVNEWSVLGLSGFYRAVSLISGTLASLPFRSYRDGVNGREQVPSIFDDPDGPDGQTVYEWKETAFLHLLLHGCTGALKHRNEAGGLVRLELVHPLAFCPRLPSIDEYLHPESLPRGGVWFDVQMADGTRRSFDANDFWYVPGLSLDGKTGLSLIQIARANLSSAIAGERAQARMFSQGALMSGVVSLDDELEPEEMTELRREIDRNALGHENAGRWVLLNKKATVSPWTMTAVDAQFLQSRQFSIEDISRWTGIPPHLLMQTEKQTSWGTGVSEQNRGLSKFVLGNWANRFEQRASRLLARPRWAEFDFAGLERPNVEVEIDLLIKQVAAGLLTVNEARAIRNMPPLPSPNGGGNDPAAQ